MISTSKGSINIQINDNHKSTLELNEQAERSALNQIKNQDDPPDIAVLLLSPDYYNNCTAFHAEIIKRYKKDEIVVLGIAIAACDFEDTDTIPILFKDHPLGEREITDASYQEIVNKIDAAIDHVLKKRKLASFSGDDIEFLLSLLERGGELSGRKNYHMLGAFLLQFIMDEPNGFGYDVYRKFAQIIEAYSLIQDGDAIAALQQRLKDD